MPAPLRYFARLSTAKAILWCYLVWYLVLAFRYFDPTPRLWLNSLGISAVVGVALRLSVSGGGGARPDGWQVFRLFMMPFAVSSFSALIKGRGFFLVFPPPGPDLVAPVAACAAFLLFLALVKALARGRRAVA